LSGEARLLIVSPHFDDAVLSCTSLVARHHHTTVATVFTEGSSTGPVSSWDERCGFSSAGEASARRREEDASALRILGARPVALGLLDGAYRIAERFHSGPGAASAIVEAASTAIGALIDELAPELVAYPLGLLHVDHLLTRRAVRRALATRPRPTQYVYCDLPYAWQRPALCEMRLRFLGASGERAAPVADDALAALKRATLDCYRSQHEALRELAGARYDELYLASSERVYRVEQPEGGHVGEAPFEWVFGRRAGASSGTGNGPSSRPGTVSRRELPAVAISPAAAAGKGEGANVGPLVGA
jgi:LmbE family N-acetylglucosaminyl deacetylase